MTAARGDGEDVSLISVASREAQYMYLLNVAKTAKTETAFCIAITKVPSFLWICF